MSEAQGARTNNTHSKEALVDVEAHLRVQAPRLEHSDTFRHRSPLSAQGLISHEPAGAVQTNT